MPVNPQPNQILEADVGVFFVGNHQEAVPAPRRETNVKKSTEKITDQTLIRHIFKTTNPQRLTNAFIEDYVDAQKLQHASQTIDPKALIGIEVEVENALSIDPNVLLGFWQVKDDGSLRNNGREFVTAGAIPARWARSALQVLFRGLNPNIDFSQRTSIHIHQDVRGMTVEQLLSLLFIYIACENLLFKFAGATRRSSIYCVPLIETDLILNNKTIPDFCNQLQRITGIWQKYTALNLLPIHNLGSIEYRQLPGTMDIDKILIWINMLSAIKVHAYSVPHNVVVDQISRLNTNSNYYEFVRSVFGSLTAVLDTSNLLKAMERPVYLIKNSVLTNPLRQLYDKIEPDSNLGQFLDKQQQWSQEQLAALRVLATECCYGSMLSADLHHLWKDMKQRTALYLRTYPQHKQLILLLCPKKEL